MKKLQISVDPRVELLSIVQYLSDYGKRYRPLTDLDFDYTQAVTKSFSEFRNHPVVELFSKLVRSGFNFSHPIDLALNLTLNLHSTGSLILERKLSDLTIESAGGLGTIDLFVRELEEFCQQSEFPQFYQKSQKIYDRMVNEVQKELSGFNPIGVFEDYYGIQHDNYHLILAPLCDQGGYGIWMEGEKGQLDAYCVTGPVGVDGEISRFVNEPESLMAFIWHEFGHSVINPLTSLYLEEVEKFQGLYERIAQVMKEQAYGSWEYCVNEHIIRAIVIRLVAREFCVEHAQELWDYERNVGFYLLDPLMEWLKGYEGDREKHKLFADFYPSVFEVFERSL